MKIITLILVAMTAAILGYTFAQYRDGVARMYVIKARQGTISEASTKAATARLVLAGVEEKALYVSAEQPRNALKTESLTHILKRSGEEETERRSLRGKLYYATSTQQKSRWIFLREASYDGSKKELTLIFEDLSPPKRESIEKGEGEEPPSGEETLSNLELVVLA